jgi:Methyltransferase domain
MENKRQQHWEKVYANKADKQVSWTEQTPAISLSFIEGFHLPKTAAIIDVGGGDSTLVDYLLQQGYKDITVLDVSATALENAKKRLGPLAKKVTWIATDVTAFKPNRIYDVWHDRATFHFLTTKAQIEKYLSVARKCVSHFLTIGTFSNNGPDMCSGLHVKQYSEASLQTQLHKGFAKIKCITTDHITPFGNKQNFLFCSFRRKAL